MTAEGRRIVQRRTPWKEDAPPSPGCVIRWSGGREGHDHFVSLGHSSFIGL